MPLPVVVRGPVDAMRRQMLFQRMRASWKAKSVQPGAFPTMRLVIIEIIARVIRHPQPSLGPAVGEPMHEPLMTLDHQLLVQVWTRPDMNRLHSVPPVPHLNHVDTGTLRKLRFRYQLRCTEVAPSVVHRPMPASAREQQVRSMPSHVRQPTPTCFHTHFAVLP